MPVPCESVPTDALVCFKHLFFLHKVLSRLDFSSVQRLVEPSLTDLPLVTFLHLLRRGAKPWLGKT